LLHNSHFWSQKFIFLEETHCNGFVTEFLSSQKLDYQHLAQPPFALNTTLNPWGILPIKFWHTKAVIFPHLFSILSPNLGVPLKSPLYACGLP